MKFFCISTIFFLILSCTKNESTGNVQSEIKTIKTDFRLSNDESLAKYFQYLKYSSKFVTIKNYDYEYDNVKYKFILYYIPISDSGVAVECYEGDLFLWNYLVKSFPHGRNSKYNHT